MIGTGVRGKYLIGNLPPAARVVAICDCAESRMAGTLEPADKFASVLQHFRDTDARQCATYQDYRKLLDSKDLDAVIIAAPDHHHAQAGILAMQAGLDVYLEKPLTVTIREGRRLAEVARQPDRVLQVGSQQRTMEMNRFACEFVRDGGLGKISQVVLPNYPGPIVSSDFGSEPAPKGLAWDLFLGPTALRPHNKRLWVKDEFKVGNLLWRGWDLFRDFSGHLMTNWGAHSIDMVQYALGRDDSGPARIEAIGPESEFPARTPWGAKTPAPQSAADRRFWPVFMQYDDGVKVMFVGGNGPIVFYGERGSLKVRRNSFEADPPELIEHGPDPEVAKKWKGNGHVARPHLENWFECMRSRTETNAPVEVGHRTATVCHLANIARELARPLNWDPVAERFLGDESANDLLDRPRRKGFELP